MVCYHKTLIDKKPPQQNASLIERAREVVASVEAIKKTNSKAKTVDELNLVLGATHDALHDSNDATKTEDHAKRLAKLSEHTLGHESPKWKKLGMALAFFACAALVVVGVLAGIPTG